MRKPRKNDRIRIPYGTGRTEGYTVHEVHDYPDGSFSLTCNQSNNPRRQHVYLNGYRMIDGRCIGKPFIPGSALWEAAGRTEINELTIESPNDDYSDLPLFQHQT